MTINRVFAAADTGTGATHTADNTEQDGVEVEIDASAYALPTFNRPAAKDAGMTFEYTEAQLACREDFTRKLGELLTPEALYALGAYITPGNPRDNGKMPSLMVALSLPMPALTFENPDTGKTETTRPWNLNVNANLLAPKDIQQAGEVNTQALTFDLGAMRAEMRKRAGKK
jgi:hypothetical protein